MLAKTHRNLPARSENVKRVDNPFRNLNKRNRVDSSLSVKRTGFISKSVNNDATVKQVWKATAKIFASVGSMWRPTRRKFTLCDTCPLTRITKPEVVPLEKPGSVSTSEPAINVHCNTSPPNAETKAVNDPVNANDLYAN
ncbi:hypothetical protein Tco_1122304 [Tanacetum coccineum]|uniref:Uncharacterized protein n=1 Tax=Tanacetum coccineum TaxID=301880 RepID=A0ABQ5J080_9ASTR